MSYDLLQFIALEVRVASNRIYRPHRDRCSRSRRRQGVLRRPHVCARPPRVVRDGPGGPLNYGPDGDRGSQLFFYQAAESGTYSRGRTGLHHLAFLVASRAVVRGAHQWACARKAVILDEPREFPSTGNTVLRPTGWIRMDSNWKRCAHPRRELIAKPLAQHASRTNGTSSSDIPERWSTVRICR